MSSYSDSTIDNIIEEEDLERKLRKASSWRAKLGRNYAHSVKVKKIIQNIEHNLKAKGPYPIDRAKHFIENYETYPEVRPYTEQILDKVMDTKNITSKRWAVCDRLLQIMKNSRENR